MMGDRRFIFVVALSCLAILLPALPMQPATASPGIEQPASLRAQEITTEPLIAFLRQGNPWLMNADGSDARQITSSDDPIEDFAWSPSGRYIVFQHGGWYRIQGDVARADLVTGLFDVSTGENREIFRVPSSMSMSVGGSNLPVWALDADELLLLEFDPSEGRTYSLTHLALDGTPTGLASFEEPYICGGPDGPFSTVRQLVYLQQGGPWTRRVYEPVIWRSADPMAYVRLDCGNPRAVDLASGNVVELPYRPLAEAGDGLLVQGEGASWATPNLYDPATGALQPLFDGDAFATGPDGAIYFTRIVEGAPSTFGSRFDDPSSGSYSDNTVEVWRTDVDASEPTLIASFPAFGAGVPRVAGDGSAIVFGIVDNPTDMIGVDESGVDWFTPDLYAPHLKAVRIDIATAEVTVLTDAAILPKPQPAGNPATEAPSATEETANSTETPTESVTPTVAAGQPEPPSGDGWIAYVGDDGNIWLMQPDGSQQTQITTDGTMEHGVPTYLAPTWSPDGTVLVFYKTGSPDEGIMVYRDGTLTLVPNTARCGPAAVTLDNSRLLYSCASSGAPYETAPTVDQLSTDPHLAAIASSNLDGSDARVLVPYALPNSGQSGITWVDSGLVGFNGLDGLAVNPRTGEILATFGFLHSATAWLVEPDGAPVLTDIPFSDSNQDRLGPFIAEFLPGSEQVVALVCEQGCYPDYDDQVRSILILNRDGSIAQRLIGSDTVPGLGAFTVSPDATTLIFATYSTGGDASSMLWTMPIGEGTTPLLPGSSPAWQPNPDVAIQQPAPASVPEVTAETPAQPEPAGTASVPEAYLGTWEGIGVQVNPSVDWPITVTITGGSAGEIVGTTTYPEDGCTGNLILREVTDTTIVTTEQLTIGHDFCADNGTIILGPLTSPTMAFTWEGIGSTGTASSATGSLTRADSATTSPAPAGGGSASQPAAQGGEGPVIDTTQLHSYYIGTFSGTGNQTDPDNEWPITVTFTGGRPGEVIGTVEYPTLGCGGELILVSINPNDEWLGFKATERITYGHDNCIDGGTFVFSSESAVGITFGWTSPVSATRASGNLPEIDPNASSAPASGEGQVGAPAGAAPTTPVPQGGGAPPSIYDPPSDAEPVPIEPEGEGG